jgi:competence protein ComEA
LDINRADAADLQALPSIGPVLARRIVAHREAHGPFRDPADLLHVSGLGATRLARLRGLIRTAEAP